MTDCGPVVVALDEQHDLPVNLPRWTDLAVRALRSSGVHGGEMNLLFIDEPAMASLNREHMGEDGATDVLSFPLDGAEGDPLTGEALIGDVVVCPVYAARQAPDHVGDRGHDGSVDDEIALLVVHGVLHLLGHDHVEADETRRMQASEQSLLAEHYHRS